MEIYDRGWRLKALRKKRGLSQKAVADRLGVDRAAISAYERNIATPRIDVLENLALLYRTSVDYILGMEHRAALYIDDLSESQQETVRSCGFLVFFCQGTTGAWGGFSVSSFRFSAQ